MKKTRATLLMAVLMALVATISPPIDVIPALAPSPAGASFPDDAFPAYDLGIQNRPFNVMGRDAGVSAMVGGTSFWAYGDTFRGSDGFYRSNTGALSVQGFNTVREPVDGSGFSASQLIPHSATEIAYNSTHDPDVTRYWVWPTGVIPRPGTTSLIFWERGMIPAVTGQGAVGLADISPGQTVASRRPNAIFEGQDCGWGSPVLGQDGYVYLYANKDAPGANRLHCPDGSIYNTLERMVARVPLADAGNRGAYRFWNGSGWDQSPMSAVDVMSIFHPTVSWNEELGSYIAIGGLGVEPGMYSTAPAPQGPWSDEEVFVTPLPAVPGTNKNYAWIDHPEHAGGDDGGVMMVTYHRSTTMTSGDIQMLAVDTRSNAATELDAYINRTYQEMLGRQPTTAARNDWANRLRNRTDSIPSFVRYLAESTEGLAHRVDETFEEVLGRSASQAEKDYWVWTMVANDWGHDELLPRVAASSEYSGDYATHQAFVAAIYLLTLGRAASQGEIDYWVGRINTGMSRGTFVRNVMVTEEAGEHQARQAYSAILGRSATNTQADHVARIVRERIEIRIGVASTAEAIGA